MAALRPVRPPRTRITWISPILGLLVVLFIYVNYHSASYPNILPRREKNADTDCPNLPGLEDILVVLKTGVTEARDKLPVHFQTTLRCIPNYIIFSDYNETIDGVQLHDVLDSVTEDIKQTVPDFSIYNRVRATGRTALTTSDMNPDTNSAFGKPNNPGWKLDKWKFLPMIEESLKARDDAKWYVFMEADTYFFWPNLLSWLEKLDHQKPYYLGNQMQIANVVFAHGGSGFVLSNPAMRAAVTLRAANVDAWDRVTADHWAGDCVLGKLLADAGVGMLWSWPVLISGQPSELDFFSEGYHKRPWCHAPIAYHHLGPEQVRELWDFERKWYRSGTDKPVLYQDVFRHLVRPKLGGTVTGWDNRIGETPGTASLSLVECRVLCYRDDKCVQFSYTDGECWTSHVPIWGAQKNEVSSGWITERVDTLVEDMGICTNAEWIVG
ncbi:hypothetical protein BDV26DRAFT_1708 [Aspergillus bertholletiae]|uniref:N-acetylgalactosaminide beta-1,3-galactosyltransferase n=1 Tax=Aspergillus bertholletiae TaxID=1226010 RepID=A0A5N7BQB9_9EURO|nr:hypothetical protein BDV26DRAFT_1708 [Aspergillus bertholletiae]